MTLSKQWLEAEYQRRREVNPVYSLRAYARYLGLQPGRLSELLSGKRPITAAIAEQFAGRIGLSPEQRKLLLDSVKSRKQNAMIPVADMISAYHPLGGDAFEAIREPHHFAILALMDTKDFKSDIKWVAQRLELSVVEVRQAFERLERLGLLKKEKGVFKKTQKNFQTTNDISSPALRASHKQSLTKALAALDGVPLEDRDITSITVAIHPSKMLLAKKLIREFRLKFSELVEDKNATEVFDLNVQFVPVTKLRKKREK